MRINTPFTEEVIKNLKAGDSILINGTIYTGRDAAHEKLVNLIKEGKELPFDIKDQVIYYVGPAPAGPGRVIGSAGPTSSYRMDKYAPILMERGLKTSIGKGSRSDEYIAEMIKHKGLYLQAVGGLGALLAETVMSAKVIAFEELGPEAIFKLEVKDFPVVVTYDIYGNNLIEEGVKKYANQGKKQWRYILKEATKAKLMQ